MILSILIPSIPERSHKLQTLLKELYKQIHALYTTHPTLGIIEVLVDDSVKFLDGGLSIGEKRGALVQRATGKYLCFLDDDDNVSPNYIEQLARMAQGTEDVLTFRCLVKNDHYWSLIDMSFENLINEELGPDRVIKRTPWHVCPVHSAIAKTEAFSKLNHNEDWDWMQRVLKNVRSEDHTDMILTQYNHSEQGSEADKIVKPQTIKMSNAVIITLAIDGREKYTEKSINLEKSIAEYWKCDTRVYKSYPSYCTPHDVIPYKFKFDLMRQARADGYTTVIWLDSSIRLHRDPLPLIGDMGVMAFHNLGHPLKNYISDVALANMGVSEKELEGIEQTWGGAIGFDFTKDKACEIFEEVCLQTTNGSFENNGSVREGFVAHRHDQAIESVVFWKHGYELLKYGFIVAAEHSRPPYPYGQNYYIIYGD